MSCSLQLPNQRKQQIKWQLRSPKPRNFTSRPINEEFQKLNQLILDYDFENNFIRETIAAFRELETNPSAGEFLLSQFNIELQELSKKIDQRSQKIDSLLLKSNMKKQKLRHFLTTPSSKSQIMQENSDLINEALSLERQNILLHMKLRVLHDHRDLCKMKCDLSKLEEGSSINDEENEIYKNKLIIRNLKHYIEHEKKRSIEKIMKQSPEDSAATTIQKSWRKYKAKKEFSKAKAEYFDTNQKSKVTKSHENLT